MRQRCRGPCNLRAIKSLRARGSGKLNVNGGNNPGRSHGDCRASQDRSSRAERQDSGNDESSPGAHDSSMANPEASGLWRRPAGHVAFPRLGFFFPLAVILRAINERLGLS